MCARAPEACDAHRSDLVLVDPKRVPRGDDVVFVRFMDIKQPFYTGRYVGVQIVCPPAPSEAVDTDPPNAKELADYTWSAQRVTEQPLHMVLAPFNFEDPAPVVGSPPKPASTS